MKLRGDFEVSGNALNLTLSVKKRRGNRQERKETSGNF